ncbi:flagellin [Aliifodinibius sp. S!AR15-10]|uniref:flagellin n=1 Tax=Aliifodinibius sp. S!AR15-10 TaxID=2950437 RepID=UPI00285F6DC3|nr:flagellin [Aliifodinibius sp. S!AR15-10]MDR8393042.1 flagellin [Aliifodinibius sp. S!AR15-10]
MPSFGDLNRVNTNIQSLDSQFSLNRINSDIAENQLKMSTGKRINRAEDDSAGYSIATKLRSRVGGLNQAMQNVGDAKSVLDIAEASYSTVMDSLVEMKSLATQAANDSLGDTERDFIGDQIEALGKDINEVSNQTVYQDYELLNGSQNSNGTGTNSGSLSLEFQVGERKSDTISTDVNAVNVGELFASGGDQDLGATTTNGGAQAGGTAIQASQATAGSQGALTFDDGASSSDYREFISAVDSAINTMSENVNSIGITQSSLSVREETLSQSISANESAKSRIMDTDFAKAQSESVRLQILQQTATSALAQANNGPQSVLGFIG